MRQPTPTPPSRFPVKRKSGLAGRALLGLFILALLTVGGTWLMHAGIDPAEERDAAHLPAIRSEALAEVRSWGYQLQRLDLAEAARSRHDLLVIDETLDGRTPPNRRKAAITTLKRKPDGGRRIVLAYLSIGEAESYRPYWQREWVAAAAPAPVSLKPADVPSLGTSPLTAGPSKNPGAVIRPPMLPTSQAPAWLGQENPEWRGNFAVRFWDPEWQAVLTGSETAALDRLMAAGFDGVYLDRADVYTQWTREIPDARSRMVDLVTRLSAYAKGRDRDFLIALQNAEEMLGNRKVRSALDLIAKEDLLFGIAADGQPNSSGDISASVGYLKKAQRDGLPILVVEYLDAGPDKSAAQRTLDGHGFISYFAPRRLDSLRPRL